ncbi:MAG: MTH938/NDUFAF3 family protein [Acidobacteriota bacterium]
MNPPTIEDYGFGHIVIDGRRFTKDVIIFPDRVSDNWWRIQGHSLAMADLDEVVRNPPEVLVVGQGRFGKMDVPETTRAAVEALGIELVAESTAQACQTYNHLRGTRRAVAALHLTC